MFDDNMSASQLNVVRVTDAILYWIENQLSITNVELEDEFEDLGMDSFDKVDLVMDIEDNLNVSLNEDDVHKADTIGDLVELFVIAID